tara:strand:- start:110 stop:1132 length:1023 start_codon:yes stop_codon:yes gene_type:complete
MLWICFSSIVGLVALFAGYMYVQITREKNNEHDPVGPFLFKVGLSIILLLILAGTLSMGELGALLSLVPGVLLGLLWVGPVMNYLGGGAINSLMGGGQRLEAKPLYSMAEAKWRQGKPQLAIELIDDELVKFPCDFEGQMLKAQIQMESLHDFPSAEGTLLCIASQHQYEPGQVARALNQLADWQKKKGDVDAMKGTLAGLRDRYPNTGIEFSCAQRLARLGFSIDSNDPRDASEIVSECLKQLEEHPLDNHTREQLARVYFGRYGKPDLAWEEMNKLFENRFQQPRDISRWLNLMADWHLKKDNPDGARQCLKQITARYPNLPCSEAAQERLTRIKDLA